MDVERFSVTVDVSVDRHGFVLIMRRAEVRHTSTRDS